MNFLFLITVLGFFSVSHGKRGYMLTAPARFFAGGSETICMTFTEVNFDIQVTFKLLNPETNQSYIMQRQTFSKGAGRCFLFLVPQMSSRQVNLHVESDESTRTTHGYGFQATKKIYLEGNSLITFVQTDKPIYKPGQTVKARLLTMRRDLTVLENPFPEVYIEDAQGSRIMQWKNIATKKGLASVELDLSKEPVLGTWKIIVKDSGKQKVTQTFKVEEYVLPKYEVTISAPEYVNVKTESFKATVCAKYTYGKMVKGDLLTEVCVWQRYASSRPCIVIRKSISGCTDMTVNATELMLTSQRWPLWNAKIKIFAEVLEEGTGVRMNQTVKTTKVDREVMRINLRDHIADSFKPGLPYYGKAVLTWLDGSPVKGETVQLTIQNYYARFRRRKNYTTNNDGEISFSLPTHNTSIPNYYIEALVPKYKQEHHPEEYTLYTPRGSHYVRQWYSPSGSFIKLRPMKEKLACGDTLRLQVHYTTPYRSNITFHYQVMSRATIVATGSKNKFFYNHDGTPPVTISTTPTTTAAPENDTLPSGTGRGRSRHVIHPTYHITPPPPVELPGYSSRVYLDIPITPQMSEQPKIIVYYIHVDGEIVADSVALKVQPCFKNKVGLGFSERQKNPGEPVGVELTASPGSMCSVGLTDKSVHVLAGDNQLSTTKVFKQLEHFNLGPHSVLFDIYGCGTRWFGDGRIARFRRSASRSRVRRSYIMPGSHDFYDSSEAFKEIGMIVASDLVKEMPRTCFLYAEVDDTGYTLAALPRMAKGIMGSQPGSAGAIAVRKYFPETWLWKLLDVGPGGTTSHNTTVPDTITDWVGSAFCTHPTDGFGVSQPATLRAFRPFFASFSLPYSIIRGEKVPIVVTVFNYLKSCLVVQLELKHSSAFEIDDRSNTVSLCVCGGESRTYKYTITPKELGKLNITVEAESVKEDGVCPPEAEVTMETGHTDAVMRSLLVEAEGKEEEFTYSTYICLNRAQRSMSEDIVVSLPPGVVEGSARGVVSVIGDVMGPTLSGLDKLLRLPTGCGEQNMLKFAPNIYVLQYLSNTNRLDPTLEKKALHYLKVGYQRELTYRHSDGSYSAFGKSDPEGSMWLTAFVVKSFAQAKAFIYIDQMNIDFSIDWLKSKQLENGCFPQVGSVHNKVMKGGLADGSTPAGLTAYVLIAMLEAGLSREEPAVEAAIRCLNKQYVGDAYSIALMAYAYTLYERTGNIRMNFMDKLERLAIREGSLTHWSQQSESTPAPTGAGAWAWMYQRSPSADVEMSSYVLLASIVGNREEGVARSIPIVRWLSKQRNPYGGFASTQDTVVALQALAQFASVAYSDGLNLKASISGTSVNASYDVTDNNSLLLQTQEIPVPNELTLAATGTGCVFMQASVKFNVPSPQADAAPAFLLTVKTFRADREPGHCKRKAISICTSYTGPGDESNMVVVAVRMVSGWTPIEQSLVQVKEDTSIGLKKYEIDNNMVNLYFDKLDVNGKCLRFNVEQTTEVEGLKPSIIQVYDYYDTDLSVVAKYTIVTRCGTKEELPFSPEETDVRNANGEIDWSKIGQRRMGRGEFPHVTPGVDNKRGSSKSETERNVTLGRRTAEPPVLPPWGLSNKKNETRSEVIPELALCPTCLAKAPQDLVEKFCSSRHVYKILKRRSRLPMRVMADIRPPKKNRINKNGRWVLDTECSCPILQTARRGQKLMILTKSNSFELGQRNTGSLLLDDNTIIFPMTSADERHARRGARKVCRGP